MARPSQCLECGCYEGCLYPTSPHCAERADIEVGWIVKWRNYFGNKTGKVVGVVRAEDGHTIGYDVSENRSTQGFPGPVSGPVLVSPRDVIEVVSHG